MRTPRKIRVDLTGHKYGLLTVSKLSTQRLRDLPSWDCICDCGNTKTCTAMDLRAGQVGSCGCNFHKGTPKGISGKMFSELTAISSTGIKSNNGDYIWECKCSCGTACQYPVGQLNSGSATNCGCKTSEKISKALLVHGMKGEPEYRSWSPCSRNSSSTSLAVLSLWRQSSMNCLKRLWRTIEDWHKHDMAWKDFCEYLRGDETELTSELIECVKKEKK